MEFIRRSENVENLVKALVAVQAEIEPVYKEEKTNGAYKKPQERSYACAKLETILQAILPLLAKNNIALDQSDIVHEGHLYLCTTITHISGEFKSSYDYLYPIDFLAPNNQQEAGKIKTYQCRYAIKNFLCIPTPDRDIDDGQKSNNKSLYYGYKSENLNDNSNQKLTAEQLQEIKLALDDNQDILDLTLKRLKLARLEDIKQADFQFALDTIELFYEQLS